MQMRSNTMLMQKSKFGDVMCSSTLCKFKIIYYLQAYACISNKEHSLTSYASDSGWESKGGERDWERNKRHFKLISHISFKIRMI